LALRCEVLRPWDKNRLIEHASESKGMPIKLTIPEYFWHRFLVDKMINTIGMKMKIKLFELPQIRLSLAGLAPLFCLIVFQGGPVQSHEDFSSLVEKVLPAVVSLEIMQGSQNQSDGQPEGNPEEWMDQFRNHPFMYDFFRRFFDEEFNNQNQGGTSEQVEEFEIQSTQYPRMGFGSGFIISKDGKLVTNYHVIENASEIKVRMADEDTVYKAEVIGSDPETDISVLQIVDGEEFDFIKFGDSKTVRVGDPVLAIGNPLGVGISASKGIISATFRTLNGPYDNFFQTDASINLGNSGGPLINLDGDVIGVNTAIKTSGFSRGSIGVGFSMSSAVVSRVVEDILQDGKVSRGWLGVYISTSMDEQNNERILVDGVFKDGPAREAGILPGDLIISVDGTEISEIREFVSFVGSIEPGKEITMEILRGSEPLTLTAILGDRPQNPGQIMSSEEESEEDESILGMNFGHTPDLEGNGFANPDTVVNEVLENSPAAEAGIQVLDQVEMVNSQKVVSTSDIQRIVDQAIRNDDEEVTFFIIREGVLIKVAIQLPN